ncbi:MAG: hypothetical protein WBF48_03195 [Halarcobacter sp.]
MTKVETISNRVAFLFKQMRSLSNEDYEKVILNIELLKKQNFIQKFKREEMSLFEYKTFKELIISK